MRGRDVPVNWLWSIAAALHWFNPLAWVAMNQWRADREEARDAAVLRAVGNEHAESYAAMLVNLVGGASVPFPAGVGMASGYRQIRRRIVALLQEPRRPTFRSRAAWLLLPVIGCASLTEADKEKAASINGSTVAMVTQTYDVHELLIQVPNFENAPSLTLANNPPNVKPVNGSSEARLEKLHREKASIVIDLRAARYSLQKIEDDLKAGINPPVTEGQIEGVPQVYNRNQQFEELNHELKTLRARLSENHPSIKKVQEELESSAQQLKVEKDQARSKLQVLLLDMYRQNVTGMQVNLTSMDVLIEKTAQELAREQQRNSKNKNLPTTGLSNPAPASDIDQTGQEPSSIKTGPNGETSVRTSPRKNASASEIDGLISILKATVDPKSWETGATIRQLAGQLIILQTPANHKAIERLVNTLREDRKTQISIETRLVQLNDSESGIQSNLRDKIESSDQADKLHTGVLLDDVEVNKLLRALQGSAKLSLVTAPRVTTFNGQRAYVLVVQQRSYIADYTVVYSKDGNPLFNPRVETVSAGSVLDIQAAASVDRKSISLSIRDQFSTLEGVIDKPFDGGPKDQNLTIQQPILSLSQVLVNTNIGDGRTMLFRLEDSSRSDFPGATTKPVATTRPSGRQYLLVKASIVRQQGPATQGE